MMMTMKQKEGQQEELPSPSQNSPSTQALPPIPGTVRPPAMLEKEVLVVPLQSNPSVTEAGAKGNVGSNAPQPVGAPAPGSVGNAAVRPTPASTAPGGDSGELRPVTDPKVIEELNQLLLRQKR